MQVSESAIHLLHLTDDRLSCTSKHQTILAAVHLGSSAFTHASCLQVVSEYRKARAIMADVAANSGSEDSMALANGANKGIWGSIFLEVDKVSSQLP